LRDHELRDDESPPPLDVIECQRALLSAAGRGDRTSGPSVLEPQPDTAPPDGDITDEAFEASRILFFGSATPDAAFEELDTTHEMTCERQEMLLSTTGGGDRTSGSSDCEPQADTGLPDANIADELTDDVFEASCILFFGSATLDSACENRDTTREKTPEARCQALDETKNREDRPPRVRSKKKARKILTRLVLGKLTGLWDFDKERVSMPELREISSLDKWRGTWRVRMLFDRPKPAGDVCTRIWKRIVRYFKIPQEVVDVLNEAVSWRSFTLIGAEGICSFTMKKGLNKVISREIWVADSRAKEKERVAEFRPRKGKVVVRMSTIAEGQEWIC